MPWKPPRHARGRRQGCELQVPHAWGTGWAPALLDLPSPDELLQHGLQGGVQAAPLQRAFSSRYFGCELCFPNNGMTGGSKATLRFQCPLLRLRRRAQERGQVCVGRGRQGWLRSAPLAGSQERGKKNKLNSHQFDVVFFFFFPLGDHDKSAQKSAGCS